MEVEVYEETKTKKDKFMYVVFIILLVILLLCLYYFQSNKKHNEFEIKEVAQNGDATFINIIKVEVSGAINNPGIYEVENTARIADLIAQAGGISDDAQMEWVTKKLNIAQYLEDTQKLYIPFKWEISDMKIVDTLAKTEKAANSNDLSELEESKEVSKVNLNTSSVEELDTLPGIGLVYAQKIIDNRPYENIEDFKVKVKLSESTMNKIVDLVSL